MKSIGLTLLNKLDKPKKTVLFLGYSKNQTKIIDVLIDNNCLVYHTENKLFGSYNYDYVICFGYRHLLNQKMISSLNCPIFNLHISYLPYNRGAHPNFWSFYDNTPSGVTIHLIDEGIDTGPIVFQKYVNFKKDENTFKKTYIRLINEVEKLFIKNIKIILSDKWTAKKQRGKGSHHYKKNLPINFSGWDSIISDEIFKLHSEGLFMNNCDFLVNGREISNKFSPYIIAEMSANHNGSLQRAKETLSAAKKTGVDAVKIQTYTPDTMTIDVEKEDFIIKEGLWEGRTLYNLYKEAYTPFEWHSELFEYAKKIDITLFSSPFDETAVDLLEHLNTPAYKVASFEIVDLPLIKYIAKTKKPIFMSTGMASIKEIGDAIETAKSNGSRHIVIFHCISSYPTPISEANLKTIQILKKEFDVQIGLSDHTTGNIASLVATSLGASVIEKHFTLNRMEGGVDSTFSLEPNEMSLLVKDVKNAHLALGAHNNMRSNEELKSKVFRRSLYFVNNISVGDTITQDHVKRIRPGYGLEPKYYNDVIGSICLLEAKKGDRVTFNHFMNNKSKSL